MSNKKRVLYVSHGHPDFDTGGAEWAAYYMYQSMKNGDEYEPFLLARYPMPEHGHPGSKLMRHDLDDHVHLLPTSHGDQDPFLATALTRDPFEAGRIHGAFRELLELLRPDVIHFHHYIYMGVELIGLAKAVLPGVRIVMTLHEFGAICANHGSMITTEGHRLCVRASPLKCCGCFPGRSPGEFFVRERFFKSNFAKVDVFIAPSRFLQSRFVEWGLEEGRFRQLDNGRPTWPKTPRRTYDGSRPFLAAFFGQIVFHKGVDVFLRAAAEYRFRTRREEPEGSRLPEVRFAVHGTMQYLNDDPIQQAIQDLSEQASDVVHMHGGYDARNMSALLSRVDCVVVPSKWWENSPLVIQEAFMAGVPVICSNIGGMAEKVTDGVNGLHFVAGDHSDLLSRVLELAGSPALYEKLTSGIPEILSDTSMAALMREMYDQLIGVEGAR